MRKFSRRHIVDIPRTKFSHTTQRLGEWAIIQDSLELSGKRRAPLFNAKMKFRNFYLKIVRNKFRYLRYRVGLLFYRRTLVRILTTPSIRIRTNKNVEIHSIVSHDDLLIYLASIKSFLRYYRDVGVVIHDDGTISDEDKKLLTDHLPGAKIHSYSDSEKTMKTRLKDFPRCLKFRQKRIHMRQIFDFSILSLSRRIISLDSDTLFLNKPREIIRWIEEKNNDILYVYEKYPAAPWKNGKAITEDKNTPFQFAPFLCGGFVCFFPDIMDLPVIERYCKYVEENCEYQRYRAQTIYALCVGYSRHSSSTILPPAYQNPPYFQESALFRHYWIKICGWRKYLQDFNIVFNELASSSELK